MKVSELVAKLQAVNPDCEVYTLTARYNGYAMEYTEDSITLHAHTGEDSILILPNDHYYRRELLPLTGGDSPYLEL